MWTNPFYFYLPLNPDTNKMLSRTVRVSNEIDIHNGYFMNVKAVNISQRILRVKANKNVGK